MPLYELICVSAISPSTAPFRELVRSTTRLVVDNGGAVRGMQYWGRRFLPQRAKRHQQYHYQGDYFLMHFDTSPPVLSQLTNRFKADPKVVKWTTLKLGDKLPDITPPGSAAGFDVLRGDTSQSIRAVPARNTVRPALGGGNSIVYPSR